jgi:hypothetical protein
MLRGLVGKISAIVMGKVMEWVWESDFRYFFRVEGEPPYKLGRVYKWSGKWEEIEGEVEFPADKLIQTIKDIDGNVTYYIDEVAKENNYYDEDLEQKAWAENRVFDDNKGWFEYSSSRKSESRDEDVLSKTDIGIGFLVFGIGLSIVLLLIWIFNNNMQ